jgi:3-hydroxyisobutyrate dehydrogenase-like beta-hydroxyacid dehydrogenase
LTGDHKGRPYGGRAALAEACAFAERAGVDAATIPQALPNGRAASRQK